jgi:hypothetical protein
MMRPRTKLQLQVIALSKKLPKITKDHKKWAYAKLFKFYALTTKHTACCFECGHQWRAETGTLLARIGGLECPKCGRTLKPTETKHWSKVELGLFQIISVFEGFQVIEMFQVRHACKKGTKPEYDCFPLYQHWISPKGKLVIYAIKTTNCYWNRAWSWGSDMEIRHDEGKYYENGAITYPGKKILPVIRRNGYRGNSCGLNESYLFQLLLSQPRCETLIKAGQTHLVREYGTFGFEELVSDYSCHAYRQIKAKGKIEKYWSSIKICIRNNYKIKDPTLWFDQMELLEYFHKDIHNAKYICPEDLQAEHQKLIEKKQAKEDQEELKKLNAKIEKANQAFQKAKQKYFGINLTNGEINIIPLDHVREFFIEGKKLHHCVFTNGYYKKKNTLILSARKGEERLETIELSLKDLKVIQSRGPCNQNTPYHDEIINLVNSNINKIRKVAKVKTVA